MPTRDKAPRHISTLFSPLQCTTMHLGYIILQPSYLTHRKTAGLQSDFPILIFNPQQIHRAR